jgi:hypothetical protein
MSKPQTTVRALVLVDLPQHGLKAGHLVDAEAPFIEALQKSGEVDPHPAAVEHAQAQGAKIVQRPEGVREVAADSGADFADTQPAAPPAPATKPRARRAPTAE